MYGLNRKPKASEGASKFTLADMNKLIAEGYHPHAVQALAYIASKEGFVPSPKDHIKNTTWGFGISSTSSIPKKLGWDKRDFSTNPLTAAEGVEGMIEWFKAGGIDLKSPKWANVTPEQAMGLSSSGYHSGKLDPLKTALDGKPVPNFKGTVDPNYPNTASRGKQEADLYKGLVKATDILPQLKEGVMGTAPAVDEPVETAPAVDKSKLEDKEIFDNYDSIMSQIQKEMETSKGTGRESYQERRNRVMGHDMNPSYVPDTISPTAGYSMRPFEEDWKDIEEARDTPTPEELVEKRTRRRIPIKLTNTGT